MKKVVSGCIAILWARAASAHGNVRQGESHAQRLAIGQLAIEELFEPSSLTFDDSA